MKRFIVLVLLLCIVGCEKESVPITPREGFVRWIDEAVLEVFDGNDWEVTVAPDIVFASTTAPDFAIDMGITVNLVFTQETLINPTITPDIPTYCDSSNVDSDTLDLNDLPVSYFTSDANTESWAISIWHPSPEYKCSIHGIIDYENERPFTMHIENELVVNVCARCLADLLNNNLPQLELIERIEE